MRHLLMIMAMLMISTLAINAQEQIEDFSYASENVVDKKIGLPIVRPIYGGTKIIPEFVGDWPKEMEGAFEYACRIWEEVMPTTFPVRMKVILDNNTTKYLDGSVFSKVGYKAMPNNNNDFNFATTSSPWSQIKANTWLNKTGIFNDGAFNNSLSPNMFREPEVTITYYNYGHKLEKECSFSLDEVIDNNHYDFVTMALRDIARSFGIIWNGKMQQPGSLDIMPQRISPFEKNILYVIGQNSEEAYTKATTQKIVVGGKFASSGNNHWELYSPSTWDNNRSLNYFIPNASQKITQLLSYEFGKGTVVRDIACRDTYYMFASLLGWTGDVAVSIGHEGNNCAEGVVSTEKVLPFKGAFISKARSLSKLSTYQNADDLPMTKDEIPGYIEKFIPKADRAIGGIGVSFLKNDGTWDEVHYEPGIYNISDIDVSDFELHNDIKQYARSCDGYIRCRVMIYRSEYGKQTAGAYYYLLDYLPETVQLARSATVVKDKEDEYLRDVKIGFKNIEGVTKIVVSQLDEYNELPYYYEVKDFKKGYFVATVDKDYTTTFTITAYNKNGSTESYPYVLSPLDPSPIEVKFSMKRQNISISASKRGARALSKNLITKVEITSLDKNQNMFLYSSKNNDETISVGSLPRGRYVLSAYDAFDKKHTFKFSK